MDGDDVQDLQQYNRELRQDLGMAAVGSRPGLRVTSPQLWQGEPSLRLSYAQTTSFCSFPFFPSLSEVLRAVLIAAGSSIPSLLAGSSCAWGRGRASQWWSAAASTATALPRTGTSTPSLPATLPGISSRTGTKQGVEPVSSFNRTC